MVIDVITRMAQDTGLDLVQQRSLLLRHANNAAREIYNQLECNKIYREVSLLVPQDMIVSLPSYIGELRGMRIHTNDFPFDLHAIGAPRYTAQTWQYKFRNWRDLGESPIKKSLVSVAPFTITCNVLETPNAILMISGQTNNAMREEESLALNSINLNTTKSFGPNIYSIGCTTARSSDIHINDDQGNEVAVLYNTDNRTRYKIVDVSRLPWPQDANDGTSIIDVLYKHPLYTFVNDSDQFPAGDGYDDAWYYMGMHLYYKPMQGREQDASSYRAQCEAALVSMRDTSESQIIKKVFYGRNKFFGLFKRWRYFPGSVTNVDSTGSIPPN